MRKHDVIQFLREQAGEGTYFTRFTGKRALEAVETLYARSEKLEAELLSGDYYKCEYCTEVHYIADMSPYGDVYVCDAPTCEEFMRVDKEERGEIEAELTREWRRA